jgi:hypothetical protein
VKAVLRLHARSPTAARARARAGAAASKAPAGPESAAGLARHSMASQSWHIRGGA